MWPGVLKLLVLLTALLHTSRYGFPLVHRVSGISCLERLSFLRKEKGLTILHSATLPLRVIKNSLAIQRSSLILYSYSWNTLCTFRYTHSKSAQAADFLKIVGVKIHGIQIKYKFRDLDQYT